jgi:tannase/feruloyl esterase
MSLDLREFRRAGGKHLLWHGWADANIPPGATVDYYERLTLRNHGLRRTQAWARLFMVPTLHHCAIGGGYELNRFDPFDAIVPWVEHGNPPGRLIAYKQDPQATCSGRAPSSRTRRGHDMTAPEASTTSATSFPPVRRWRRARFSGPARSCSQGPARQLPSGAPRSRSRPSRGTRSARRTCRRARGDPPLAVTAAGSNAVAPTAAMPNAAARRRNSVRSNCAGTSCRRR